MIQGSGKAQAYLMATCTRHVVTPSLGLHGIFLDIAAPPTTSSIPW